MSDSDKEDKEITQLEIKPGSTAVFHIEPGITTVFHWARPYQYHLETTHGTVIDGIATPSTPLSIMGGTERQNDIKILNIIFKDAEPIHIVKPAAKEKDKKNE